MRSIVSYPSRGPYGDPKWRGNCSGRLIKDLLLLFKPKLYVDPAEGSGTSRDVVKEMQAEGTEIEYYGFDLHSGFNLLKDRLIEKLPREADYVFFHSPYAGLVRYSGNVWGDEPHPDDLSNCQSRADFIAKLQSALCNIYQAIRPGGRYSVLIGDIRKSGGEFWLIQSDLIQIAPGSIESILIKAQHNTESHRRLFSDNFISIDHEYVVTIRKERILVGILDHAIQTSENLTVLNVATWRSVVESALRNLGGRASLKDIYSEIERRSSEKSKVNSHWREKIRQVLQRSFTNIERGVWALPQPC